MPRLDAVRKMTELVYFDDAFEAAARTHAIVDAIEDLLDCGDIKLYTDQCAFSHHNCYCCWLLMTVRLLAGGRRGQCTETGRPVQAHDERPQWHGDGLAPRQCGLAVLLPPGSHQLLGGPR
jgi:hypothetical protein